MDNPEGMTADDLIDAFVEEEETFEIELKGGIRIRFRPPHDAGEYYRLGRAAGKFATSLFARPSPEIKPYLPLPEETLKQAYWVSALAVSPTFTQPQAVKLAKRCGGVLPYIYSALTVHLGEKVVAEEKEALDGLGEDCEPIASGAPTSPSVEMSIDSIPMN